MAENSEPNAKKAILFPLMKPESNQISYCTNSEQYRMFCRAIPPAASEILPILGNTLSAEFLKWNIPVYDHEWTNPS